MRIDGLVPFTQYSVVCTGACLRGTYTGHGLFVIKHVFFFKLVAFKLQEIQDGSLLGTSGVIMALYMGNCGYKL